MMNTKNLQSGRRDLYASLYEAFHTDESLQQWTCDTPEYDRYFKSLPQIDLSSLEIPPNTNILFYGHSFLHEILQNIVIANEHVLVKGPPEAPFAGKVVDSFNKSCYMSGWLVQYDFTVNSSIIEVQNYKWLQTTSNVGRLESFMQNNFFDIAFFMKPHSPCCFQSLVQCQEGQEEHARFRDCGLSDDHRPLFDVIDKSMRGNVYQVMQWATNNDKYYNNNQSYESLLETDAAEPQYADQENTISTTPLLADHPCNIEEDPRTGERTAESCASDVLHGHQCQPGRLVEVSQKLMAKVQQKANSWCGQGSKKEDKCCDFACGTCGGPGCGSRPGGPSKCCTSTFTKACKSSDDVACVIIP